MQKKLFISAVVALVLIGGVVLVWEKKGIQEKAKDQSLSQEENIQTSDKNEVFVTDVDPDVSHWQTKETEFFTTKFPKEWYWIEEEALIPTSGFSPDGIITNNPSLPLRYPEVGVNDIVNNTEVVIGYGILFTSTDDIVTVGVEDMSPVEGCKFLSDAESVPIIKSCTLKYDNHQVEQVYHTIYKNMTVFLNVRTTDDTSVSNSILEDIARNIILTNKK